MLSTAMLVLAALAPLPDSMSRAVRYRVDVPASIETVWSAWTDSSRIKEWFAPASSVETRPLGRYDILFDPEAAPGLRGAENNMILAMQAPKMLSFTWDAPATIPEIRKQRTSVVIRLESLSPQRTRVWFEQTGWGRGGQWDEAFDYFTDAWKFVLTMLHYRHSVGPVDWKHPPVQAVIQQHARAVTSW
jgi:uncharacterized protein YndB with AHSA1/START domain